MNESKLATMPGRTALIYCSYVARAMVAWSDFEKRMASCQLRAEFMIQFRPRPSTSGLMNGTGESNTPELGPLITGR